LASRRLRRRIILSAANHPTATTYMSQPPVSQSDDQMVELTERARAISRDAGTKVTSAMRDMISAGAGIAGFAVESAKDLVQYMVRRGQMTQEEADKLTREAEAAHLKRPKAERERLAATRVAAEKAAAEKKAARLAAETALPLNKPLSKTVKTAPLRPPPVAVTAPEPVKAAKAAAPPKAAPVKAAPVKAAPVKAAPVKAAPVKAAPVKAAAKAPAKKAASAKKAAPAKKAAKKKK
jgi:polyhydroxyalkanoate synthesis regulator phasin